MKSSIRSLAAVLLALLWGGRTLSSAEVPGESVLLDGVAAYVNEHVITIGAVVASMEPEIAAAHETESDQQRKEILQSAYDTALTGLIEHYLVLDSYADQEGRIPEWVVDQRVQDIIRDSFGGDRAQLEATLQKDHLTYKDWRDRIKEHLIVASMRSAHVVQKVSVSASNVRNYYEKHRDEFSVSAELHLHSLHWADNAAGEAEKVAGLLADGKPLDEVVASLEEGTHNDLGWMRLEELSADFRQALENATAGQNTKVIALEGRHYILHVEQVKPSRTLPFAEAQSRVEKLLQNREAERLHQQWISLLRETAYVKVVPVGLDW